MPSPTTLPSVSACKARGEGSSMALDPRVAVGIINYGDYRHLPACLDSLKRQSLRADRVILLDNQSLDGPKR